MDKYIARLKERHIKVTPQRIAIVEIMEKEGHISVRDIFEKIRKRFPTLSLATVYKNINAMLESEFIKELKIVGQDAKYELTSAPHAHMICKTCGRVEDIMIDTRHLLEEVSEASGYKIEDEALQFFGVCPACQSKSSLEVVKA